MPPIGQQGSRGGLITAMVIFAILFLTSAIFAIYFNANARQFEQKVADIENKYKKVIRDDQINNESDLGVLVQQMRDADPTLADPGLKTVDVLNEQAKALARVITTNPGPGLNPVATARARVESVNNTLSKGGVQGINLRPDNLLGNIELLANALVDRERTMASTSDKLQRELAASTNAVNAAKEAAAEKDKAVAAAQADAAAARDAAAKDRSAQQAVIDKINQDVKTSAEEHAKLLEAKALEVTTANQKITEHEKLIDRLKAQLALKRGDVKEPSIRRTDGAITQISQDGKTVYINRGQGDQITAGLTFEVYDQNEGVPPLGDGMREEDMPVGKGAIEVVSVEATSSVCRIIKTTPGMAMRIGDVIANLVYDPQVKSNFVIYGKFDLDRNKVATDQEADVIKRLVTQWGGKIVDKIDVDSDYVVLGTEPVLPNFTPEDLQQPENVKRLNDAQAELEAYNKVRADAKDLHIPVMNQNRFLYFVGYYDEAKR
jgi:hypothetical protein